MQTKETNGEKDRFDFYAYLDRMKFIRRWPLMRCTRDENIMEHSQCVALITHALCAIKNTLYGGHADEGKAVLYALCTCHKRIISVKHHHTFFVISPFYFAAV